ncbi:TetR/AcrR family transcriptional regulator [Streptomyces sp. PCS3-D2]|uniref:TetR/AcrR family transcriptional regulator n=1 Tax=Streptomyces sp. PCS3-D2 TaxID=1460244 RepID=UPI00272D993F|nr:TetR/AcrR family transcriptional regulator [Streptomyces sp. PCS3-D2]WKV71972.1 TetR/AcrR family transcriptional regulator [Streptomyces sp. PCS3-D2]
MPAARDTLLDAAAAALAARPWPDVRMVEVAAAAGVSRQTLYNEFGGKAGLGRALVRRAADRYLEGVDEALSTRERAPERLAAVAEWTVRAAREHPLLRALLTGGWGPGLPAAGRREPGPGELARTVRDRAAAALTPAEGPQRCELAVRLALSYVIAPGEEPGPGELIGLLSAPIRTAGAR